MGGLGAMLPVPFFDSGDDGIKEVRRLDEFCEQFDGKGGIGHPASVAVGG